MADDSELSCLTFIPKFLVIEPQEKHTATVIWLHGLGDTGEGMYPAALRLSQLPALAHVKFVLPHAEWGNGGMVMPSWFDCYSFDIPNRPEDEKGLFRAVKWLNSLIDIEVKEHNIPSDRVVVGGLSQGGAVSLLTAATADRCIAGVFALSSYVPLRARIPGLKSPFASSTPIFWGHGTLDIQVRHSFSVECAAALATQLNIPLELSDTRLLLEDINEDVKIPKLRFQSYRGVGHWYSNEELDDLTVWMSALVPRVK